jgi:hypothetical protein
MSDLIPLDDAVACIWPISDTDPRMHLRILPGPPSAEQRTWVEQRGGLVQILDATGSGDAHKWWRMQILVTGWADPAAAQREMAKVDCALGKQFRAAQEAA